MQIKPLESFVLTFPKDEAGKDVKYRFMLTLSKKLKQKVGGGDETIESRLIEQLGTLDGVDGIGIGGGRYTIEVTIARTFDPDAVIEELKRRLTEVVLSEIIRPPLVVPA
jgi:hypothetical protein